MEGKAILVIEDNIIWHKLLKRVLVDAGYTVHIAATCADGIRLAELHQPDCIVSDFHLPDGDAVAVCSRIRAHKQIKEPPVIILSSDPEAEFIAYAECHAARFILKGAIDLLDLPGVIRNLLAMRTDTAAQNK